MDSSKKRKFYIDENKTQWYANNSQQAIDLFQRIFRVEEYENHLAPK